MGTAFVQTCLQVECAPFALVGETVTMIVKLVPSTSTGGAVVFTGGYLEGGSAPTLALQAADSQGT